jgi:hypothetical protein
MAGWIAEQPWCSGAIGMRQVVRRGCPVAGRSTAAASAEGVTSLRFTASPHSLPAPETLTQPTYRLELDLVNDTVSCVLQPSDVGRTSSHSHYSVSNHEPAHTLISSSATFAVHPTLDIRSRRPVRPRAMQPAIRILRSCGSPWMVRRTSARTRLYRAHRPDLMPLPASDASFVLPVSTLAW